MTERAHQDVVSEIVCNRVCSGCGVCAGICPSDVLEMAWQEDGSRVPVKTGECPPRCDLCLRTCPFSNQLHNESSLAEERFSGISGIHHDDTVGYFLSTYVAYSKTAAHRSRGSSGGMCTWMLETLLNAGQVDAVACVGRGEAHDQLFAYQVLANMEEVRAAASSRYYPVDIAGVVKQLQSPKQDKRYAIVGLPCTIKAVRLAMLNLPMVRTHVVTLLGLVCGHMPNRYYTEYLARLSGVMPDQISTVDYRLKGGRRASNYYFQARGHGRIAGQPIPFLGRVSRAWGGGYFQCHACNYCEDVFAETADAVFMDAWLPEYESDPQGHSLIVVRCPSLGELLKKGSEQRTCHMEPIPVGRVVASQGGLVLRKVLEIGGRLYRAQWQGEWVPNRRAVPSEEDWRRRRREIEARYAVQRVSKELWLRLRRAPLWRFHMQMWRVEYPLRIELWWRRLRSGIVNPCSLFRLLLRILRRCYPGSSQRPSSENSRKVER